MESNEALGTNVGLHVGLNVGVAYGKRIDGFERNDKQREKMLALPCDKDTM